MKKSLLLFSLLVCFLFQTYAQNFLILHNGHKVEYKKLKIDPEQDVVEIKKPAEHVIKISEINYILHDSGDITYLKDESNQKNNSGNFDDSQYRLMERVAEGKISIYRYMISEHTQNGNFSTWFYFLEKGKNFELIFNSSWIQNRNGNKETLEKFVSDNELVMKKLNSADFKATTKNIQDLIREYNINEFEDNSEANTGIKSRVIIYRGSQSKNKTVQINVEGKELGLSANNYTLLSIPDDQATKICLSNDKTSLCDIIRGYKHQNRHYEAISKKNGDIIFELRSKKEFDRFLVELREK